MVWNRVGVSVPAAHPTHLFHRVVSHLYCQETFIIVSVMEAKKLAYNSSQQGMFNRKRTTGNKFFHRIKIFLLVCQKYKV